MKTNKHHYFVCSLLGGIIATTGDVPVLSQETRATASAETSNSRETASTKTEATGSVSSTVSVTGPDGKPATYSVTVTTVGPDGKVHTVTNQGPDGQLHPIPLPSADGKGLAMSLHPAPTRMEKVTYAGVVVEEVPEVLSSHLPIPKGLGLVVTEVLSGSPAEKAGLRKDDILLRFDDQLLATREQLRKLTRSRKTGEKVRFSIVHEGKETAVEVIFGEREENVANPSLGHWQPFGWMKEGAGGLPKLRETAEQAKIKAAEVAKAAAEVRRRVGERPERAGATGLPPVAGMEAIERLDLEVSKLRQDLERSRGSAAGGARDVERPRGGPKDSERPQGGPRDRERP